MQTTTTTTTAVTTTTIIIAQTNNNSTQYKKLASSLDNNDNNNREINVSMLIMLKKTVNLERDNNHNTLAYNNNNYNNSNNSDSNDYIKKISFKNFTSTLLPLTASNLSYTEKRTTTMNISSTDINNENERKHKNNNYNNEHSFLLDKTTFLDLKKGLFTTPKALASTKTFSNNKIKNSGTLSAILNTITSSLREDALKNSHNHNNTQKYAEIIQKLEKVYSMVNISEKKLSTSTTPVLTSTTTSTSDNNLIIIEDMDSTSADAPIIIPLEAAEITSEIVSTTTASIHTTATAAIFATSAFTTTPNAVMNMSASAQLKNNNRYDVPLSIPFAPNFKRGKKKQNIKK